MARTRILVTVGPASSSPERLRGLLKAGADAFRINFSHGTEQEHRAVLRACRNVCEELGRVCVRVADLQGPKIRLGELPRGAQTLRDGEIVRLVGQRDSPPGSAWVVTLPSLCESVREGDRLLLGDGNVELEVVARDPPLVTARVTHGGPVTSHQGVYLPEAQLDLPILEEKDLGDLKVALEEGVEWVAVSFVRSAEDIRTVRQAIAKMNPPREPGIIAKIERRPAVENIIPILQESDAIMVARGDLGIETSLVELPVTQKVLLHQANLAGKPAIVATQMLLSMVHAPRPTRAEVSDVANAILDGADCLMLSEETAVGDFPVEATDYLRRTAEAVEALEIPVPARVRHPAGEESEGREERAVARSALDLAEEISALVIVVPTHSGRTARWVSRLRPRVPILALTSQPQTPARLGFTWGVRTRLVPAHLPLERLRDEARRAAGELLGVSQGTLVLTAGYPVEGRPTNLLLVSEIGGPSS
jgi:pyruvate kinase